MTSTDRDDVDELDVIVRVVGSSSRGNVEVAAATCRRYPSQQLSMNKETKETTVKYGIHVYQFLDDERFSTLDSLLLQLGSKSVLLFECPPPLQRYFENVLSSQNIDQGTVGRTNLAFDVLAFLKTRARGDFLQIEKERKLALPLVTALLDLHVWRFDLPSYVDLEVIVGTPNQYMCLDSAAAEAVNLLPSPGQVAVGSLYGLFARHCKTKLGPKTLERWLRQPLLDVDAINTRLNVVESLVGHARLRSLLRDTGLKSVPDVLPVLNKFQKGTAGLGEIFKLYLFSRAIASLATVLNDESNTDTTSTTLQDEFSASFAQLQSSLAMFDALVEHVVDLSQLPDLRVKADHDETLSELQEEDNAIQSQANDWFAVLRDTLIGGRDSASLADGVRLEPSTQHGLVFRSTKGEDERLLRDTSLLDRSTGRRERLRILTILKNGVYFTTDTLASLGDRLLQLRKEYGDRQADIVTAAMATAASYLPVFESASTLVASLDVLQAFACQAAESATAYARPTLLPLDRSASSSDVRFDVVQARHPCVELVALQRFIPNDFALSLSPSSGSPASVTVITGPNTGGKSTYIRTAGVMAVLAQVGAYLPCQSATISIVDRLFCRVGAGDVQQRQTSTFLLEMLETSRMLSFATRHSLLIIDELGRGTSTADGFGLACAIARYIATQLQCRCLFATHFHELTRLSVCKNLHVSAVVEQDGNTEAVTMTYEVRPGACQQSFGVHVAAMTDFPAPVLHEAKRKLVSLESTADGTPSTAAAAGTTNGRDEVAHKRLRTVEENFTKLHDLLPSEPTAVAATLPKQLKVAFPRSLVDFAL